MSRELIEKQARLLADEALQGETDIEGVYWFPDDAEVRLIELTEMIPVTEDGAIRPFYFPASPRDDLPSPSGVALIRPAEFGRLALPQRWGDWQDAKLLGSRR
jgi:hypothetical protein